MIHVAGTRMIAQGTDGLLQGGLTEGVMSGVPMACFVPLHLSALDQHPAVLPWIQDWMMQPGLSPLTPEEWFYTGHGLALGVSDKRGIWALNPSTLWAPPLSVVDVAINELMLARHKCHHINHIFVAPRLHTYTWRKKVHKVCDLVFEAPTGARSFWPAKVHEPLIIRLTRRFASVSPWQLRQSNSILALGRELQGMWTVEDGAEPPVLCQLSRLLEWLEAL
jgi:hypothetical protein